MPSSAVHRLKVLLETERTALLQGDLSTVESLLPEKTELSEALGDANSAELKNLSKTLARNSALLASARDGVADVVSVLRKQHAARTVLSSYDMNGKPTQIASAKSETERRF